MQTEKITEGRFQADCFHWFNNTYVELRGLLFHVPNGEKRDIITANRLKGKGVIPGIPDFVFNYRSKTYFIELKNPDGTGKLSKEQLEVIEKLEEHELKVFVIDDLEQFKMCIKDIIAGVYTNKHLSKKDFLYKNKVFSYLYDLSMNEIVFLKVLCTEETKPRFVFTVKEFIRLGYGKQDGFEILFTNDYTGLHKVEH